MFSTEVINNFYKNIKQFDDMDKCWEWTGKKDKYGYGRLKLLNKKNNRVS